MPGGIELATAYVSLVVSGRGVGRGVSDALKGTDREALKAGKRSGDAYAKSFTAGASKARLEGSLSKARDAEATAAGRVRIAETRLAEVRSKANVKASTLAAAEERLAATQRGLAGAQRSTAQATSQLTAAESRLSAQASSAGAAVEKQAGSFKRVRSSAIDTAKSVGLVFGGVEVARGIGKSISLAKDFDLTIRQVGVQTNQSGDELKNLSTLALKMGADTVFSAKDAGDAMLELAKGGMTAADIKGGALKNTLLLAAAGGLNLGDAATYVVQGMTTFGLKAAQASQVATALAGGANASTASVESLGQALSQVGPGAKNAGVSLQETVGALAAFDNAGIKGSDAGTSLKTFLQRLVPTSKQASKTLKEYNLQFTDAKGNFKSLADISQLLQNRLGGLSQEQQSLALTQLFGSDATRAATVLMKEGAKGVNRYTAAAKDQKAAQDLANTAMSGASGAFQNFQGSVETLGIKLGSALLPELTDLTKKASGVVSDMTNGTGAAGQFADGLGDVYKTGKQVVGFLNDLPGPLKSTGVQALIAYAAFSKFGPGLTSSITSLRNFGTGLANTETRAAAAANATAKLKSAAGTAAGVGGMLLLYNATKQTNQSLGTMEGLAGGALAGFAVGGVPGAAVGAVAGAIGGLVSSTKRANDQFKVSADQAKAYADSLDQVTFAATRQSRQRIGDDLQKSGALKAGESAGLSRRTLIDAALGRPEAIKAARDALASLNVETDRLNAKLDKQKPALGTRAGYSTQAKATQRAIADNEKYANALGKVIGQNRRKYASEKQTAKFDAAAALTRKQLVAQFGQPLVTKLETKGFKPTHDQAVSLARAYKLSPKKLVTLARLQDWDLSLKQAQELLAGYRQIKGPVNAKAKLDDKEARAQAASLKRVLDDLARTRYVHYQVINPSTNKPKVGAGGQTGAGSRASSSPAARSSQPLVANLYDESGALTAVFRGVAEDTAYSVLKTEGVFG